MGILALIKGFIFGGKSSMFLYIVGGLIIVAIGGYIHIIKSDNKKLEKEKIEDAKTIAVLGDNLNDALVVNRDNLKEFNKYRKSNEETIKHLARYYEDEVNKSIAITKILERIKYDKKTKDAVAAPVLINAFRGLRKMQTKATTDNNESKNSKTTSSK